jgi:23S rRNA maturation-related 3'-5' exoribonuclease YhaM
MKIKQKLQDDIKLFLNGAHNKLDYQSFTENIFKDFTSTPKSSPLWKLLGWLANETDFYTAPASTRYHGSQEFGLVKHSLAVLHNSIALSDVMLPGAPNLHYMIIAALFHDLCKVNMYEISMRNVKNKITGKWEAEPYYTVREDYLAQGHGIESMLRINKFVALPEEWNYAVRFHMGAYDVTDTDAKSMQKAMSKFREVLLLQTADMMDAN